VEVGGRLGKFGESGDLEGLVADDRALVEIADPAGLEDPGVFGVEPASARGENAALHLEGGGIEFDDTESAEKLFGGIEEIVIVNLEIFPENPALRAGVGLRRLALDLVAERVLTLVGVGKVDVVENEKAESENDSAEEKGKSEAIEADATGLEGHNFVVLAEDAESDENGDKGAERRELVDEVGNEVAEVVDDDEKGDMVAGDVVEKLEEGEDFEEKGEGRHDDEEKVEEAAQEVDIDDGRKAGGRFGDGRESAVTGAWEGRKRFDLDALAAEQAPQRSETGQDGGGSVLAAVALHAREKGESGKSEDGVGGPHAGSGREHALAGKSGTDDEEKIVGGNDERR
jgi:hypothetical protein